MSDSQQALMIEEGSDESDRQMQIPQRNRLAPAAMVVAIVLAVSLAFFGGLAGFSKPVAGYQDEFLEAAEEIPEQMAKSDIDDDKEFDEIDKDKNGKLDLRELTAYEAGLEETPEQWAKKEIETFDKDKDEKLTLKEWVDDEAAFNAKGDQYEDVKKEFDEIDKEKKGNLDLSELMAYEAGLRETPGQWANKVIETFDKDKDEKLSLKEWVDNEAAVNAKGDQYEDVKKKEFRAKIAIDRFDKDQDEELTLKEWVDDEAAFNAKGDKYEGAKKQFDEIDEDKNSKLDLGELTAYDPGFQ